MAKSFADLDDVAKEHGVGGGNGGFLKLATGNNRVRIVSGFEALAKHWAAGKLLGICVGKEKGCKSCNAPDEVGADSKPKDKRPNVKFMMYVIDREAETKLRADAEVRGDNPDEVPPQVVIAELGWSVVNAIKELSQDPEYGFEAGELPPYDVNIKKTVKGDGKKPSDTEYSVIAARSNTPLTDAEKAAIAGLTDITVVVERMKAKERGEEVADGEDTREAPLPEADEVEEVDMTNVPD